MELDMYVVDYCDMQSEFKRTNSLFMKSVKFCVRYVFKKEKKVGSVQATVVFLYQ